MGLSNGLWAAKDRPCRARPNEPGIVRLPVSDADEIRFAHLSTSQGLSQTRVSKIVQDDKGFLWFGAQYSLNRYDGYSFKVFEHAAHGPFLLRGGGHRKQLIPFRRFRQITIDSNLART
jgi:hypothetical protein